MKSKLKNITAIAMVLMILPLEATYYRWVDENGKVHYSYTVPPEKSKLGHVELDKQGVAKKEVISAKRKKKLEEIAKLREEDKAISDIEKKRKKEQDAEDKLLLSVFSSEDELVKSYNSKLQLAQVTINLLKSRHKKQSEKLEQFEEKYERMVDIKHKQLMEKKIDLVLDNLKIYQHAITENIIEKDKVTTDYKSTLARFRKLMARTARITPPSN